MPLLPRPVPRAVALPVHVLIFLGLVALFFVLTCAIAVQIGPLRFYNSDAVQPFMTMRDTLASPRALFGWHHPPNPFVFPDLTAAAVLVASPISWKWLPLVYPGVIVAAYCYALGWVLAASRTASFPFGVAIGVILFALLFGVTALHPEWRATAYVFLLLPPFWHTGAVFSGLLTVAALSVLDQDASRRWLVWAALALAFVAGSSDRLYLAWFTLPLLVAAGLQAYARRHWRGLRVPAALVAVSGIGNLLSLVHGSKAPPCGLYEASFGTLVRFVSTAVGQRDLVLLSIFALMALMGIRGLVLVRRCLKRTPLPPAAHAELMLIGSSYAAAVIPFALGCTFVEPTLRYCLPAFVFPYAWIVLLGLDRIRPAYRRGAALAAGALAVAAWSGLVPGAVSKAERLTKSPLARCLDRADGRAGLGDYWTAKRVMFETDYRVHIVQLQPNATPWRYNYNDRWFRAHASDGGALRPTFVVIARLDPDAVLRRFGKPDRIETCGGHEIWRYDRPLTGFDAG